MRFPARTMPIRHTPEADYEVLDAVPAAVACMLHAWHLCNSWQGQKKDIGGAGCDQS